MANIQTGSIVADIAGRVGNNIYSRNRSGMYVKAYQSPVQPDSSYQLTARATMGSANSAWNALSDSDYKAWVEFTKHFSRTKFNNVSQEKDPRAFFISCYINKYNAAPGGNPSPVFPDFSPLTSFTVTITSTPHIKVYYTGESYSSSYTTILYSTVPQPGQVRSINSVQQVMFLKSGYYPDYLTNVNSDYSFRFTPGTPSVGQRVFISARVIHNASGICIGWAWNSAVRTS